MTLEAGLNLAAGIILAGLGLVVLAARRRHPPALAFGVFALGGGGFYLFDAFAGSDFWAAHFLWAGLVVAWGIGALWLFVVFPVRLRPTEWRAAALAATIALAVAVVFSFAYGRSLLEAFFGVELSPTLSALLLGAFTLVNIGFAACLLHFPLRVRRLPADASATARSVATMAVGFCLFVAATMHEVVDAARGGLPPFVLLSDAGIVVLPLVFWLFVTRGPHSHLARNVILLSGTFYLGSLGLAMTDSAGLAYPLFRILGALVLAYAVLRGQIEGLDLKVRFAISKSTVAAVFIAVFFIASEAAQQFFGDRTGSTYFGIAIAGTLVFAMAPIQRVAEKLAARAVPVAVDARGETLAVANRQEDNYRRAVRLALRDRLLTREEEAHLFHVAEGLGIPAGRAMDLRNEVEQEQGR